jgi:MOSC domain-containing protein YiiM
MNQNGHIFQISISKGGVPKQGLPKASIDTEGVAGDQHRDLVHHGGPDRAVCLFSLERIIALQGEGHPIFPGSAGENITVAGMDWSTLAPGARIKLGNDVVLEVTDYTAPCSNIGASFIERHFDRISQKTHAGWSRLYARVLQPGEVKVGDPVKVQ